MLQQATLFQKDIQLKSSKEKEIKFAQYLVRERQQIRGWSQAELARRAKLGQGTISNLENLNKAAGSKVCKAIAKAFNVAPEVVLREASIMDKLPEGHEISAMKLLEIANNLPEWRRLELIEIARVFYKIEQGTIETNANQAADC